MQVQLLLSFGVCLVLANKGAMQDVTAGKVHPRILAAKDYNQHRVTYKHHYDQQTGGYPMPRSIYQHYDKPVQKSNIRFSQQFGNELDDSGTARNPKLQEAYVVDEYGKSLRKDRNSQAYPRMVGTSDIHSAYNPRISRLAVSHSKGSSQRKSRPSVIRRIESRLSKIEQQEKRVESVLTKDFGPNGYLYQAIKSLVPAQKSRNAAAYSLSQNTISMTTARGKSHIKIGVWKNSGCRGAINGVLELFTDLDSHICQSWKHFVSPSKTAWHDHSANYVSCGSHSISYRHFPGKICTEHGTRQTIGDTCEQKSDLFMKIIDFSGCKSNDDSDNYDDENENSGIHRKHHYDWE